VIKSLYIKTFFAFFISLVFLVSCNPARHLTQDQYLLQRNRIEVADTDVSREDMNNLLRQRPNRKIFGVFPFHLSMYNFAKRRGDGQVFDWIRNTIGEPPVIYDPGLVHASVGQLQLYMSSRGYFDANVTSRTRFIRNMAWVTYEIAGNNPYIIQNINYIIEDKHLSSFVLADTLNSLLKRGDRFDTDKMLAERERIERHLRNNGFFNFSREFVEYRIDSNLYRNRLNMDILINNPVRQVLGIRDSLIEYRHKRFKIDEVVILPEFSLLETDALRRDTLIYSRRFSEYGTDYNFKLVYDDFLRIKPRVITNHIMIRPGDYFRVHDLEQTYTFLSGMRNFRFINLRFSEVEQSSLGTPTDTTGFLRAQIQLTRSPSNAFTVEAEGFDTGGNLGVAGNLLFQNRNIFRGAEMFNIRFKSALEISGETAGSGVIDRLPFNTIELGVEAGFDFPALLLPFRIDRITRNARPNSQITAGVNYRQRPDFTRFILNLNYGFEWNETPQQRHFINPFELSSIRIFNDSILRANIPDANPLLMSRFSNHLIHGASYTYIHNTQQLGRIGNFKYLRVGVETAGNLLNLTSRILNLSQNEEGTYELFNIPFAQFAKIDADFRFYHVYRNRQSLVLRLMGGIGMPYGNAEVMPFIKSFYGGGANGIRAWEIYSLGPGGYQGTAEARFDRYGDIKLEANVEYRFGIYRFWHGALFVDAGNVWFLRENNEFPEGEFRLSRLPEDIAIGAGAGIRLDFNFFILRLDAAVPIKDPSKPAVNQWLAQWPSLDRFNFNLGIGYPF